MSNPVIVKLTQTCRSNPSQWDLFTDDGQYVYVRYRWGRLTATLAPEEEQFDLGVNCVEFYANDIGMTGMEGYMNTMEMQERLKHVLEFIGDAARYPA